MTTPRNPVLWVEDDPDHRFLMEVAVGGTPYEGAYDVAVSVGDAVAALDGAAAEGRPYRVLACDIQLPGGDGWQVVDHAHALSSPPGHVEMLSSSNDPRDLRASEQRGVTHVVKPLRLDGWLAIIERLCAAAG